MTPLGAANTRAEMAYNLAQSKTRTVVERCFGLMKSRFRCLDKTGGTLLYTAVAVLHNFSVDHNILAAADFDGDVINRHAAIQPPTTPVPMGQQLANANAVALRQNVIQQF